MLLSDAGRTRFERLIERQGKIESKLEDKFYADYRNYRQVLIDNITLQRPAGMTRSGAVRLGQKLLDRFIFIMFAEDMGGRVGFPSIELQSQLTRFSQDTMLEGSGYEVWTRLKQIFNRMNTGGDIGTHHIHRFNGGLFADDPNIDALQLPNHLFVERGQGQNEAKIAEHKKTLLYLSATYNFAKEGDAKNSIGLYTLGHIFEQSIVELEKLEADADKRLSLTDITKRKRDGVYYTPEWAVRRIIEETIEPLFALWKAEAEWPDTGEPTKAAALAYWERLTKIKVLDPACGSGAFLIVALKHLEREFAAAADAAVTAKAIDQRPDAATLTEMILANNLFGVDINPASVEITRLSLWLHTAQANKPLSSLDSHIACGNSLVDKRFYNKRRLYDDEERDRINTFEWEGDFASGSFDAVIGNPPYVKLQNFVKINADMAAWLSGGSSGAAPYTSTGTGNFDLYLPFIEKGLALLNGQGRMGYIAPNLWPTLENGEGLRGLIHEGRHLEKWLDFRSYQVFEEATTYTAIQVFSKAPVEEIRLAFAGDGDISRVNWAAAEHVLPYSAITLPLKPWLIAPTPVRTMIERLGRDATRLDQSENVLDIIVGVQATRNDIYHLRRIGKNRYVRKPPKVKGQTRPADELIEIEDEIMKPLVSGHEAKRFISPATSIYLLFPYNVVANKASLVSIVDLKATYPKAYAYLTRFEQELRKINKANKASDDTWYRYTYPKNLARQHLAKIIVAQLIPSLRLAFDHEGSVYLDNVRVNGILPCGDNGWFLLSVLNAPISNYIFKWLGKPKDNGYFEANKQFIEPLPIPAADGASRAGLTALAKGLQQRSTARIDLLARLEERLATTARTMLPLEQVLSDVESIPQIELKVAKSVPAAGRKAWIDDERAAQEEAALARLDGTIRLDSEMTVALANGKLALLIDGIEAAKLFVEPAHEALVMAQWVCVALDFTPSGKNDGKRLIDRLRKVALAAEPVVAAQIIAIGQELATLSDVLRDDEEQLHELTCRLFKLTPAERALVDASRRRG